MGIFMRKLHPCYLHRSTYMFQLRGMATVDKVPPRLNYDEKIVKDQDKSPSQPSTTAPAAAPAPAPAPVPTAASVPTPADIGMGPQFMMQLMMTKEIISAAFRSNSPPRQSANHHYIQPSSPVPRNPPTTKSSRAHSSSSDEDVVDASSIVFPLIENWLKDQDEHPIRGQDNHNFARWATPLNDEGFIRLNDLDGLGGQELIDLCPGMKKGMAKRVLEMVNQDIKKIKQSDRKRARYL
jgi:hypothetical protein